MIQHLENTSELGLSLTDVVEVYYHSVSEFIWYANQKFFVLRKTVLSNDLDTFTILVFLVKFNCHSVFTCWCIPLTEGFYLGMQVVFIIKKALYNVVIQSLGGSVRKRHT